MDRRELFKLLAPAGVLATLSKASHPKATHTDLSPTQVEPITSQSTELGALDYEDLQILLSEPGSIAMGFATGPSGSGIDGIAMQAIEHPSMGIETLRGAKIIYVGIRSEMGKLRLRDCKRAVKAIRTHASPDAHLIYKRSYAPLMGQEIQICIVASGIPTTQATHR